MFQSSQIYSRNYFKNFTLKEKFWDLIFLQEAKPPKQRILAYKYGEMSCLNPILVLMSCCTSFLMEEYQFTVCQVWKEVSQYSPVQPIYLSYKWWSNWETLTCKQSDTCTYGKMSEDWLSEGEKLGSFVVSYFIHPSYDINTVMSVYVHCNDRFIFM